MVVAAAVHPYFLAMLLAIWLSDVAWQCVRKREDVPRCLLEVLLVMAAVATVRPGAAARNADPMAAITVRY